VICWGAPPAGDCGSCPFKRCALRGSAGECLALEWARLRHAVGDEPTQREVGRVLGVGASRVQQLEETALLRIRRLHSGSRDKVARFFVSSYA
jgi:hypothetical protein